MPNAGQTPNDPQPGGRDPAPGNVRLVQAFVNSNYDLEHEHGAELLGSAEQLAHWLRRRDLIGAGTRATESDRERAVELREGLRGLLLAKHDGNHATLESKIEIGLQLGTREPAFTAATRTPSAALDLILAQAAAAQLDGSWQRLKACRECAWAFYDHSRNGAGNWCSMKVCGGRVKQRAHYKRKRVGQS